MERSDRNKLLLLCLFTFVIRLYVITQTPLISTDSFAFIQNAKHFSHGEFTEGLKHPFHPLYSMLTALFKPAFNNFETSGEFVSLIFGTLTIFPLFFLTKRIFSRRVAFAAAFILAIHPFHIRLSADVMSDVTYYFLYVTAIWTLWIAIEKNKWFHYILTGALAGLAYLTRPEGIELIVIAIIVIFLMKIRELPKDGLRRIGRTCLILASFLFVSFWYIFLIHEQTGIWQFTMKISGKAVTEMDETSTPEETMREENNPAVKDWSDDRVRLEEYRNKPDYIGFIAYSLNEFLKASYYPIFLLVLLGIFWRKEQKYPRIADLYLLAFIALHFFILERLLITRLYMSVRHLTTIVILTLPWAGIGIISMEGFLLRKFWNKTDTDIIRSADSTHMNISKPILLLLLALTILTIPKAVKPKRFDELALKSSGKWLKEWHKANDNSPDFQVIGSEKIAYYAGADAWYPLQGSDYRTTLNYIRSLKVKYLAFYLKKTERINSELVKNAPLDANTPNPDLIFLNQWTEYLDKNNVDTLCLFKVKY
ncbi:MAG: glycosyltransferase family 39 protein [Planctomycetes bacterium]|nr:glycosyltransferase family 39 protein [Planctomycetota bacterium]